MFLYTGAYTEPGMGNAAGIGLIGFDPQTGFIGPVDATTEAANPSFLALSADGSRLYAVDERETGAVGSFTRDPETGELNALNTQLTEGAHPCYLSIDPKGRFLLVANYSGGNVAVFPIAEDGSIEPASQILAHHGRSVNPKRQEGPHPHMIAPSPDGRFVYVTDLGLDQIVRYVLDRENGQLIEPMVISVPAGMGPRHFAFSPDGKSMVVIGELNSTIVSFAVGHDGFLTRIAEVSTLPADFDGASTCAHILFSPDGRFVYGSNRGHDSIVVVAFDNDTRKLEALEIVSTGGQEPRNFTLDPSGAWLLAANQRSDSITVFQRDAETGRLTSTESSIASPTPVALLFAIS